MKFKLRADLEDWLIFGGFALVLLYIIAIGVINLSTFAAEGHFAGFNPFPAFGPDYIFPTLLFYFLTLGGLFISVSSYFFDREKGFGIVTEKKDKGYSRWAKDKEIKEELQRVELTQRNCKHAGIPIIVNDKEMWVDDGEYHSLVIGATGSGKTQGLVFPQVNSLAKARESMIITDPKGEIYEKTSLMLRKRGYQILLLNFRDPQNGNAWNPMTLPYKMYKSGNQDKAIELLDDLALNILYDDSNKNADPFWEKTSADYFSGVALGLFEDAKPEEININSISLATTVGEEKFGGSTYIKEYFAAKDQGSAAAINASSTIMAPSETKGSILSVFKQKVKLFASRENLSEMLSYSDVDLESIGERPTAVFIVIQDEKKTYHSLVTILLKQIYETLISTAQKHGGKLPVRTNFILDEFANMPPLKDVTTMITAARSRRIRFTMIIQNFAQLDGTYGKDDAETIRGNCGNIIYLITTELKALEEISKMCGEVKSKKDDKTASTPLVTVSDLQRMKQYETVILRMRKQPFKTKLIPNYKLDWGMRFPDAKYPIRKKREVHTFDIKEFVKDQKKKKLLEMMNSSNTDPAKKDLMPKMNPADFMRKDSLPFDRPAEKQTDYQDFLTRDPYEKEERRVMGGGRTMGSSVRGGMTSEPTFADLPFAGGQPFQTRPTPMPQPKQVEQNDDLGFDVDELVKKIDAKIAELEEEERRNKEKASAPAPAPITTAATPVSVARPKPVVTEKLEEDDDDTDSDVQPVQKTVSSLDEFLKPSLQETPDVKEEKELVEEPVIIKPLDEKTDNKAKEAPASDLTLNDDESDDDFFDDFFDN